LVAAGPFRNACRCAGNVADYVGSPTSIIHEQLIRYGLNIQEAQCAGDRLAQSLPPVQLRRLERLAAAVEQGYSPGTADHARHDAHASTMDDPQIRLELGNAVQACNISEDSVAEAARRQAEATPPPPSPRREAARPATWLNLGAAPTGQAIAVDAASLQQEEHFRKAWFRLTNPNETEPTGTSYLLRIDCTARTIEALAHRRQEATGAVAEYREYAADPRARCRSKAAR
jgi:hypothetical protein